VDGVYSSNQNELLHDAFFFFFKKVCLVEEQCVRAHI